MVVIGRDCIDCKYLKEKEYFYTYLTERRYKIRENLNCQSKNANCGFKSRMANYRSCIKNNKNPCNLDKHFIEETNYSIGDFNVQIIVQLENFPRDKIKPEDAQNSLKGIGKLHYAR